MRLLNILKSFMGPCLHVLKWHDKIKTHRIWGRCKRQGESERKCLPWVKKTATQSQQRVLLQGKRKAGTIWITEKGKPLAHAQVELRGILLSCHKRLAALPRFSFVLQRLHSRWLLCFIQKNAQILSESHTESNAHPSVSCVSCCGGYVTSHTKPRLIGGKYVSCLGKVKSTSSKTFLKKLEIRIVGQNMISNVFSGIKNNE